MTTSGSVFLVVLLLAVICAAPTVLGFDTRGLLSFFFFFV